MKITMYGSPICSSCVSAKEEIDLSSVIELDYRNITENTTTLKEFLSYRDHDRIFADIIKSGKIGIPFFILEDGTKTFDIADYISINKADTTQLGNSCSIDGKGNC